LAIPEYDPRYRCWVIRGCTAPCTRPCPTRSIEADLEQVLEGTVTIRAEAGEWQPLAEGVQIKVLSIDRAAGQRSCLVRMAPGSRFDPHNHARNEECLILEGDLRFGDLWLRAGDYHVARAGVPHPVAVSRGGCLLFISGAL
jgi:anti-sigma factor ChrR (cupin superfamily)